MSNLWPFIINLLFIESKSKQDLENLHFWVEIMKLLWILGLALCLKQTAALKLQVEVAMKAGNQSAMVKKKFKYFNISF